MSTLLWILAVLNLIGGYLIGDEMRNMILGITIGVVGFAMLGGFATVINLLQDIKNNTQKGDNSKELQKDDPKKEKRVEKQPVRPIETEERGAIKCPLCGEIQFSGHTSCERCGVPFIKK